MGRFAFYRLQSLNKVGSIHLSLGHVKVNLLYQFISYGQEGLLEALQLLGYTPWLRNEDKHGN